MQLITRAINFKSRQTGEQINKIIIINKKYHCCLDKASTYMEIF